MARTRQRLGQHFLHDPAVIARIITAIDPRRGDAMVEIGPGGGALTGPLLQRVDALHVVELDRELAAGLAKRFADAALRVHRADALNFDFTELAAGEHSLRVVGNLPYNISTPLLFHFLDQGACIADMHLMLQREVVERMAAGPGSKRYGRLSVMLALAARVESLFDIGPGAFKPPPRVWSSFVRLIPHATDPFAVRDQQVLARLVTAAFTMRRKRISNSLKAWLTAPRIEALGIDPGIRPERLTPEDFVALANAAAEKDGQEISQ